MKNYFEGWYFKQQNENETLIFIPALHTESDGKRKASVQIVTDDEAYCAEFDGERSFLNSRRLAGQVGGSGFFGGGIVVDIDTESVKAEGRLRFGALSPMRGDIMGPFRFMPFMECRHSVMSMRHSVNGRVTINGRTYDFNNGAGYIEGDRGRSFPRKYVWTQCCGTEASVMLAAAEIPVFKAKFCGIIGAVHFKGAEYRFATYLGAKAVRVSNTKLCVFQDGYMLSAELISANRKKLAAPQNGDMTRVISESPSCRARYILKRGNTQIFDFTSDKAGFEGEWS